MRNLKFYSLAMLFLLIFALSAESHAQRQYPSPVPHKAPQSHEEYCNADEEANGCQSVQALFAGQQDYLPYCECPIGVPETHCHQVGVGMICN